MTDTGLADLRRQLDAIDRDLTRADMTPAGRGQLFVRRRALAEAMRALMPHAASTEVREALIDAGVLRPAAPGTLTPVVVDWPTLHLRDEDHVSIRAEIERLRRLGRLVVDAPAPISPPPFLWLASRHVKDEAA